MDFAKFRTAVLKFLFPDYDELTVLLHSLIILLFVVLKFRFITDSIVIMFTQDSIFHIAMSVFIIAGLFFVLCLPVYHAFSKRPKKTWEKKIMFYMIVLVDYLVAWTAYGYLQTEYFSWEMIFPLINVIQVSLVAFGSWMGFIHEEKISDKNVTISEAIISTVILTVLFLLLNIKYQQFWAVTFSVCVFYAAILNKIVIQAFSAIKKIL